MLTQFKISNPWVSRLSLWFAVFARMRKILWLDFPMEGARGLFIRHRTGSDELERHGRQYYPGTLLSCGQRFKFVSAFRRAWWKDNLRREKEREVRWLCAFPTAEGARLTPPGGGERPVPAIRWPLAAELPGVFLGVTEHPEQGTSGEKGILRIV